MGEYEDAADTGDSGDAETTEPAETSEPTETTETPGAAEARDRAGWDDAGLADLVAGSGAGGDSSEWTGGSRISNRPGPLPAFSDADAASPPVVGASDA